MTGTSLLGALLATLVFPGLGQGRASHRVRMLMFAIAAIVATVGLVWSAWFLPAMIAIRIAAAIDAYFVLRRYQGPSNRTLVTAALLLGATSMAAHQIAIEAFRIPSSSMSPTLAIGDRVYVEKLSKLWRPTDRGEVIVFTQPCTRVPFIKRVIAIGGDTVEVRCNVVYVNGTAIPNELVAESTSYRDRDDASGASHETQVSRYRERHGGHTYDVFHDAGRPQRDRGRDRDPDGERSDFPSRARPFAPSCTQSDFYAATPGATAQPTGTIAVTNASAGPCEKQAHFVVPPNALFMMGDNRSNANDSRYWGPISVDAVIGRAVGIWLSAPPGGDRDWSRFGAIE